MKSSSPVRNCTRTGRSTRRFEETLNYLGRYPEQATAFHSFMQNMKIEINFFPVEFQTARLPFWTRTLRRV
jgi:hypothetical protein